MRLADYVRPEYVTAELTADDMEGALRALSTHLAERQVVKDGAEVTAALLKREQAHTTAVGQGVAIPHATVNSLGSTLLMVAVAPQGIPFGPPGSEPCHVFFVLLSPRGHESEHIKLLARISRLVRHPGFVTRLGEAQSSESILEAVCDIDAQHV